MRRTLKRLATLLPGAHTVRNVRAAAQLLQWARRGMSGPLPALAKHGLVRGYGARYGATVLVETGTYLGDTVRACHRAFDEVFTIEFDAFLAARAERTFRRSPNIHVLKGDSAVVLPELIPSLPKSTLFWLDAHCSAGITSSPTVDGPVMTELQAILLSAGAPGFVVLVDDARLFTGENGYPHLRRVTSLVQELQPLATVTVDADVIRIVGRDCGGTRAGR